MHVNPYQSPRVPLDRHPATPLRWRLVPTVISAFVGSLLLVYGMFVLFAVTPQAILEEGWSSRMAGISFLAGALTTGGGASCLFAAACCFFEKWLSTGALSVVALLAFAVFWSLRGAVS